MNGNFEIYKTLSYIYVIPIVRSINICTYCVTMYKEHFDIMCITFFFSLLIIHRAKLKRSFREKTYWKNYVQNAQVRSTHIYTIISYIDTLPHIHMILSMSGKCSIVSFRFWTPFSLFLLLLLPRIKQKENPFSYSVGSRTLLER